jgi:hypothetical protein
MPLFKRAATPPPPPPPEPERHGLFGRKKTPPQNTAAGYDHRGNSLDNGVSRSGSTGGGLFHRNHSPEATPMAGGRLNDSSIANARQRVAQAEAAERQADQAMMASRAAVAQAREQVKILEREVEAETRHARMKQQEASTISKGASRLGRHM